MCLLTEAIRINNGVIENIEYHNRRLNQARRALFGSTCLNGIIKLENFIDLKKDYQDGLFKCKITYNETIQQIEISPYKKRNIHSLKLIYCDTIDYSFKYSNRGSIMALLNKKEAFDDILIVKNGFVTDTSFSNVVLYNGKEFITPGTCLLRGTKREMLLEKKIITATQIQPADLKQYVELHCINAMLDIGDSVIKIDDIVL